MFSGNSNYLVPEVGEMGSDHCRFSKVRAAARSKVVPNFATQDAVPTDAAAQRKPQDAPEPLEVRVGVAIIGISEIDIIAQKYDAEFQLDQTWRDPEFCAYMDTDDEFKGDWQRQMFKKAWHPNLYMINQVDVISREGWWAVDAEQQEITLKLRIKGTFRERFELQHFPFDVQNLRLEFQSSWPHDQVNFVSTAKNSINRQRFILEEWVLGDKLLIKTTLSDAEESRQGATYGRVQIYVYVARHWKFYAWNIFSILFIITTLSHFVGVVDESEFTERLPNLFTMLLVSVAFKLAVASQLPAIAYQTMIDNYA